MWESEESVLTWFNVRASGSSFVLSSLVVQSGSKSVCVWCVCVFMCLCVCLFVCVIGILLKLPCRPRRGFVQPVLDGFRTSQQLAEDFDRKQVLERSVAKWHGMFAQSCWKECPRMGKIWHMPQRSTDTIITFRAALTPFLALQGRLDLNKGQGRRNTKVKHPSAMDV